jgi:hypothetical protein
MKTSKSSTNANHKTVDTQHSYYIEKIKENQHNQDVLQASLKEFANKIQQLEQAKLQFIKENIEAPDDLINKLMFLKDQKIDYDIKLSKLKRDFNEQQYLQNNANILYNYYDIVENGQTKQNLLLDDSNKKGILSYFMSESKGNESKDNIDNIVDSRINLLEKYLSQTDSNYMKSKVHIDFEPKCEHCNSKDITVMLNDGYQFCNCCSTMSLLITDHDKPSYRDPPKEISYFAYFVYGLKSVALIVITHINKINQISGAFLI